MHNITTKKILVVAVSLLMLFSSVLMAVDVTGSQTPNANTQQPFSGINSNVSSQPQNTNISSSPGYNYYNATSVMNKLKESGVNQKYSYLPNMYYRKGLNNGNVQPGYSSYPAPMGIGDFGLNLSNGTLNAYNLTSSSIKGSMTLNGTNSFYAGNSADMSSFSIQLNSVLNNVTVKGVSKYVYWTQNVAFYNTKTHQLTFIDNVWNFTSSSLPASTIYSGNGTGNGAFPTYYYSVGPTLTVNYPFTLSLYLNSTTIDGRSAIFFNYSLVSGNGVSSNSYDTVIFNSTYGMPASYSAPAPHYLISGNTLTPTGLLNDAEFILGGPGGGSTTTLYNLNGSMTLKVLGNDGAYINVPSAYDYGTDTGETSQGVAVAWNSNDVATLNTGPSFLYGMWNASKNTGMQTYSGTVNPSNSFVFVSSGSSFLPSNASWVPTGINGKYSFRLPSNSYTINVSLSDHTSIVSSLSPNQSFTLSSSNAGLYTPLYAMSNSQLSAISSSGTGSIANQYHVFNNSAGYVSSIYSISNDFGFPVFFGIMLNNITDYVTISNETVMASNLGFGFGQALSDIISQSSNVSVINGVFYTNQYSFGVCPIVAGDGFDEYSFMNLINDTHVFLGHNFFAGLNTEAYIFNGTNNMIWGNEFFSNNSYYSVIGLDIDSSGNTIYNNYFWGLSFDVMSDYLNSAGNYVNNTWNIANQSASNVNTFNGYSFSGSIIGTSYQGGNYWWDYAGQATPFNDYYDIPSNHPILNPQGDNVPLVANYVHFIEHGLPSNLSSLYYIDFNHTYAYSSNSSNEITLNVVNGTYAYSMPELCQSNYTTYQTIAKYIPSINSGTTALSGSSKTIDITYTGNYLVNFTESSLPPGTTWYVNLSTGGRYSSTGSYIDAYLPNDTYSYTISTPDKEYSAPGGTFTVNGNPQTVSVSFTKEVFEQTFEEQGLPSGTAWSVTINGDEHSTTSSSISVSLVNGSYSAQVSSPTGYFPTPSKWLFNVNGSPNIFPIEYVSSHNESYINPVGTLYPLNDQTFSGMVINNSYNPFTLSYGIAYDSSSGLLFIPESSFFGIGSIYVYNTSTDHFVGIISGLGAYQTIYDQNTKFVYSMSLTGNITEINPSTMAVVKNLTLKGSSLCNITLLQHHGNYIYALNENGNLSVINALTLSLVKTIKVSNDNDISPLFTVYGGNAYIANTSGNNIIIVNLTTSAVKQIYLPSNYSPESVMDYSGSTLFIGGENYSDEIYNISSGQLSVGPMISGFATSIAYNSFYNVDYITSIPYSGNGFGNITAINPSTGKIIARIPSLLPLGLIFNPMNGNIYSDSDIYGIVSVYSTPQNYKVTFTETGLPTGTPWYVNITNVINSGPITGSTYSMNLPNETYAYTITTSNKAYSPSTYKGSFTVDGKSVTETVTFSKVTYNATFNETGLPSGTAWYVNVTTGNGTIIKSGSITGTSYSLELTNGTYTYTVQTINKTYGTPRSSGSFTVNGSNITENVTFSKVTYNATFTETGLPSGTIWYVNGTGMSGHNISPANVTFMLTNGTYTFTATNLSSYYTTTSHFTVTINGNNVTETVDYHHWAYIAGTISPGNAILTINGNIVPSSGSFNFSVVSGTYHIIASDTGYISYYDNFTLNNGNVKNLVIVLKPVSTPLTKYSVTFTESGLPAGTTWYVNITGQPSSGSIKGSSYSFSIANGTYSYTIATPGKLYSFSPSSGSFTVDGKSVSQSVTFSKITYTISGYILPTNASIMFYNTSVSVNSSGYYNISLSPGTYIISVTDNGYFSYARNITITKNMNDLNFTLIKEPKPTSTETKSNVTATGYNVTVSNIASSNGSISVNYTATSNGTITVALPYTQVKNATISDLLSSRLYINGTQYKNFTVAISSSGTVILTVYNLTGDPTLVWLYSPAASPPTPPSPTPKPSPVSSGISSIEIYAIIGVVIAIVAVAGVVMVMRKRK